MDNNEKLSQTYIGVDPGYSGGIAVIYSTGEVEITPMPTSDEKIIDELMHIKSISYSPCCAALENIPPAMGQGVSKTNMSLVYGSFRALRMALQATGIPTTIVRTAEVWRAFDIPPRMKDESDVAWKRRLKYKAQTLYPKLKVTKAVGDALLFATYLQRYKNKSLKVETQPIINDKEDILYD